MVTEKKTQLNVKTMLQVRINVRYFGCGMNILLTQSLNTESSLNLISKPSMKL